MPEQTNIFFYKEASQDRCACVHVCNEIYTFNMTSGVLLNNIKLVFK